MQINWEAVGAIGEIGGAVVVIATLLYLARKIRQSNRIGITSTEIEISNSFATVNESIYSDPELAELIVKAEDADVQLTSVEDFRLDIFVNRCLNTFLPIETAYVNGMVPRETYNGIESDLHAFIFPFPGLHPLFHR